MLKISSFVITSGHKMRKTLYIGSPGSSSLGALAAAFWSGIDFEVCRVNHDTPEKWMNFKKIYPIGQTPLLLNGTKIIPQSIAIIDFFVKNAREGSYLHSINLDKDKHLQLLCFLHTSLFSSFGPFMYGLSSSENKSADELNIYGRHLVNKSLLHLAILKNDSDYLLGNDMTPADIYFAGVFRWNEFFNLTPKSSFPELRVVYEKICRTDFWLFFREIEGGVALSARGGFKGYVEMNDSK
jgi:glutathione S-transferase